MHWALLRALKQWPSMTTQASRHSSVRSHPSLSHRTHAALPVPAPRIGLHGVLIYLHSGSLFEPSTHTLHEAFAPLFLLSEKRPTVCVALQMVRQQARRRISDPKQMTLQQRLTSPSPTGSGLGDIDSRLCCQASLLLALLTYCSGNVPQIILTHAPERF